MLSLSWNFKLLFYKKKRKKNLKFSLKLFLMYDLSLLLNVVVESQKLIWVKSQLCKKMFCNIICFMMFIIWYIIQSWPNFMKFFHTYNTLFKHNIMSKYITYYHKIFYFYDTSRFLKIGSFITTEYWNYRYFVTIKFNKQTKQITYCITLKLHFCTYKGLALNYNVIKIMQYCILHQGK